MLVRRAGSPAALHHAGKLPAVRLFPQVDTGQSEFTVEGARSAVDAVAVAQPGRAGVAGDRMQSAHCLGAFVGGQVRVDRVPFALCPSLRVFGDDLLALQLLVDFAGLCH